MTEPSPVPPTEPEPQSEIVPDRAMPVGAVAVIPVVVAVMSGILVAIGVISVLVAVVVSLAALLVLYGPVLAASFAGRRGEDDPKEGGFSGEGDVR